MSQHIEHIDAGHPFLTVERHDTPETAGAAIEIDIVGDDIVRIIAKSKRDVELLISKLAALLDIEVKLHPAGVVVPL